MRIATIELFKEAMKFSAGHFTIFDERNRERLHGHNFSVYCSLTGVVDENGMISDYRVCKQRLQDMCTKWNEIFLLAGNSPHLQFEDLTNGILHVHFGDEIIPFLKKDVLVLPIRNVTLEELSQLLLSEVVGDPQMTSCAEILEVVVKVASGPGQMASSMWRKSA